MGTKCCIVTTQRQSHPVDAPTTHSNVTPIRSDWLPTQEACDQIGVTRRTTGHEPRPRPRARRARAHRERHSRAHPRGERLDRLEPLSHRGVEAHCGRPGLVTFNHHARELLERGGVFGGVNCSQFGPVLRNRCSTFGVDESSSQIGQLGAASRWCDRVRHGVRRCRRGVARTL